MMSRAVQGTAPRLLSRPRYVGLFLGWVWWLHVVDVFRLVEADVSVATYGDSFLEVFFQRLDGLFNGYRGG